jgi:flavorubredoxin
VSWQLFPIAFFFHYPYYVYTKREGTMLVGIIYSSEKKVIEKLAQALQRGLEEQGHQVKIFSDDSDSFTGLAACKTIIVGSYVTGGFRPKTPPRLKDTLSKLSIVSGKRSMAFVSSGGIGERKALVQLMNDMEKQGCYMVDQQSFSSEDDAYRFGKSVELKA